MFVALIMKDFHTNLQKPLDLINPALSQNPFMNERLLTINYLPAKCYVCSTNHEGLSHKLAKAIRPP